jgi:hypothetical protein
MDGQERQSTKGKDRMEVYVSIVIGDLSPEGIETTVAADPELLRQDLVHWYNDHVDAGGLGDDAEPVPLAASVEEVSEAIRKNIGRHVIVTKSWVMR